MCNQGPWAGATGREEWIKSLTPDGGRHAATIVGELNLNIVVAERPRLDVDSASLAIRKCVRDRIQKEVG